MQPEHEADGAVRAAFRHRLACLLGAFALAGVALAEADTDSAAAAAAQHGAHGAARYRVVNLAPGAGDVKINSRGQVAFSSRLGGVDDSRAWFYDGSRLRAIGSLDPADGYARVTGLNDHGQVVGVSRLPSGQSRAFIWSPWRPIADLGTPPGTTDTFWPAINNRGVVAGSASNAAGRSALFRWSAADGIEDLVPPGADIPGSKTVVAINDDGLITGSAWNQSETHTYVWTSSTGIVDIHDVAGSSNSSPAGVSARGEVAGYYDLDRYGGSGQGARAFVWTRNGGLRTLDSREVRTWVNAITRQGLVTGARSDTVAFTWSRGSGVDDLPMPAGSRADALGANRHGQVVGLLAPADLESKAVVWNPGAGPIDLNTRLRRPPAGLHLTAARAIADSGAIVTDSNAGLLLLQPDRGQVLPFVVGPITVPSARVGVPFDASVSIADDHPGARLRVTWDWDDGASTQSVATRTGLGQWRASTRHNFATPGQHGVRATVVDRTGRRVVVIQDVNVSGAPAGGAQP